ncbi:hypothetical protein AADZ86_00020 [Colwelliaceae bacterium BS250]
MLINTVILFLKNALPVFIFCSLLLSILRNVNVGKYWLVKSLIVGCLCSVLFTWLVPTISNIAQGMGYEIFTSLVLMTNFMLFLVILSMLASNANSATLTCETRSTIKPLQKLALQLAIALLVMSNGSHFSIYLSGHWSTAETGQTIVTGMLLGFGICSSFAILLYFAIDLFSRFYQQRIALTLLILFSAGQFLQIVQLLNQVDLLPETQVLFNSEYLVANSSELGYMFNSLVGYEATPTLMQLGFYSGAVFLSLLTLFISAHAKEAI